MFWISYESGIFRELLFIRQKTSDIECCFLCFYAVSADCVDRITLDEIGKKDGRVT